MSSTVDSTQTSSIQPARVALPLEYPATVVVSRPLDEIRVVNNSNGRLIFAEDERLHRYTAVISAGVVVILVAMIQLLVGFGGFLHTLWLWGITAITLTLFLISIRPFGIRILVNSDQPTLGIRTTFLGLKRGHTEVALDEFMLTKGCRSVTAVGGRQTIFTCVAVHPDDETRSLHLISSCKEGVIDRILNRIEQVLPMCILAGQHMEPDSSSRPSKPR